MYIDYCRLMSSDQSLISYNEFANHEYLIIKEILEARSKLNKEIMEEIKNEKKKKPR